MRDGGFSSSRSAHQGHHLARADRDVDVIIVLDNSAGVVNAPELQSALEYAHDHGLCVPTIDTTGLEKKNIWVFDDNPHAPIIVYMPLVKNEHGSFDPQACIQESFCGTFTLEYTKDQTEQLCGLTQANIVDNREVLKRVVSVGLERRKRKHLN